MRALLFTLGRLPTLKKRDTKIGKSRKNQSQSSMFRTKFYFLHQDVRGSWTRQIWHCVFQIAGGAALICLVTGQSCQIWVKNAPFSREFSRINRFHVHFPNKRQVCKATWQAFVIAACDCVSAACFKLLDTGCCIWEPTVFVFLPIFFKKNNYQQLFNCYNNFISLWLEGLGWWYHRIHSSSSSSSSGEWSRCGTGGPSWFNKKSMPVGDRWSK